MSQPMVSLQSPLAVHRQAEFRTSQFRLRPVNEEDQPLMYRWRSDAETARYLSGAAPKSMEDQMNWFNKVRDDASCSYHIIEDQTSPIGFTSLINADPAIPDAEWGVVMGKYRGQGLVRIVAPLCCKCALTFGGLKNMYTCINQENRPAIRKMEQVGAELIEEPHVYRKEGELLFRINSEEFKLALITLRETRPEWTDELDVDMYIETGSLDSQ